MIVIRLAVDVYKRQEFTQDKSAFNAAMSYTLKGAVTGSGKEIRIDFNRVLVSMGTLMPIFEGTATQNGNKMCIRDRSCPKTTTKAQLRIEIALGNTNAMLGTRQTILRLSLIHICKRFVIKINPIRIQIHDKHEVFHLLVVNQSPI